MPANMVLLEKITVGAAGASSIIFSSIPQTGYTDLKVVASTRGDRNASNAEFFVKFNGATTNFTYRLLQGNATAAASSNGSTGLAGVSDAATNTANTFANSEIYIPNYTSANYKSYSIDSVEENNTTSSPALYTYLIAGLWSNTAAITSIELYPEGSTNWTQYSTFYLYGVAKLGTTPAISPYATGGDIIDTDGTYWYHTFLSSGTFTPQKPITCDYLVVAGGGGGGAAGAGSGGGGGGGLRSTVTATGGGGSLETPLSLASGTAYTVTIGAGGTGRLGTGYTNSINNGSNSVFATITATGGGGGSSGNPNGGNGGAGGGGNGGYGTLGGTGTTNQGYAGGKGTNGTGGGVERYAAGGGGGAGAVGVDASCPPSPDRELAGNGGNGVAVSISGSSVTYAGGGGGGTWAGNVSAPNSVAGTGGTGGGGNGTVNSGTAGNGTANRGGGGGGGGGQNSTSTGGTGGSGIVIVRYAV
jgi:hypothetical protein